MVVLLVESGQGFQSPRRLLCILCIPGGSLVFPEVALQSQRSFGLPRSCSLGSALSDVAQSTCSRGGRWLGPGPTEVLVFLKYSLSFFIL